jgi:hypothetical protein
LPSRQSSLACNHLNVTERFYPKHSRIKLQAYDISVAMGKPEAPEPQSHDISEGGVANLSAEAAVKALRAGRGKDIDIAAQIIAEHGGDGSITWTPEEEKKLIRKCDWHLVPIVSCSSPKLALSWLAISHYPAFRLRNTLGSR